MILLLFIYRIFSAIVTTTIVAPLWICYCIITFIFTLVNNLTYNNLLETEVPKETLELNGHHNIMFLKIITAITIPFVYLWQNLKNLKTIKF